MKRTKPETPINDFLNENIKRNPVSFHMPGHKYRAGGISSIDITEIKGADNIKNPSGIIKRSQEMIASVYGSARAFYLTNGTSQAIQSIMRYAAVTGGDMIVSRDCHISAVNSALMFGVNIDFADTMIENNIPVPVKAEDIEHAVSTNADACGILITSPNYYGMTADIGRIAEIAHEAGMFLAVDEAHGAHFEFAGLRGMSGINLGADFVCHSLHKTLPVYNQGAVLHICSDRIDEELTSETVAMTGTTSPSYPLMASMEAAVANYRLNDPGYGELKEIIEAIPSVKNDDYTRLVISTPGAGFRTSGLLHEKGIDVEAADFNHIVLIVTPKNTRGDFDRLSSVLAEIDFGEYHENASQHLPEKKMELCKTLGMTRETVPLDMATGRICGTIIVSYPPGTPVLCPGEIIDGYALDYIKKIMNSGGTVLGMDNKNIPVLERT